MRHTFSFSVYLYFFDSPSSAKIAVASKTLSSHFVKQYEIAYVVAFVQGSICNSTGCIASWSDDADALSLIMTRGSAMHSQFRLSSPSSTHQIRRDCESSNDERIVFYCCSELPKCDATRRDVTPIMSLQGVLVGGSSRLRSTELCHKLSR